MPALTTMGYTDHLRPPRRLAVPDACSRAAPEQLLSAEAIAYFIVHGYVTVAAPFDPVPVHATLTEQIDAALASGQHPSNEGMLAALPNFELVHDHPAVRGAVSSLLGPGAFLHPHCAIHPNAPKPAPNREDAGIFWHKVTVPSRPPPPPSRHQPPRAVFLLCRTVTSTIT